MTPKLSILIITVPSRADKLQRLLDVLRPQLPADQSVELIVKEELHFNDGGPTIGANRNAAVADASGDYVCFVDDDDNVPEYYVAKILEAIKLHATTPPPKVAQSPDPNDIIPMPYMSERPDVVGIQGHYILGQNKPELFIHSIRYKEWKTVDGVHYRCPNHLNPVKREIALQVPYPEKNFGEDMDYSTALIKILVPEDTEKFSPCTEVMIDDCIMYFYLKD